MLCAYYVSLYTNQPDCTAIHGSYHQKCGLRMGKEEEEEVIIARCDLCLDLELEEIMFT